MSGLTKEFQVWTAAFDRGRALGDDYGEACERADEAVKIAYTLGKLVSGDNSIDGE